jgi:choline dehydrogenase-like flavoprotein
VDDFDLVIVGGGSAGCALAGRLAGRTSLRIGLVEAGPDYGPLRDQHWLAELLNARRSPTTHDWGFVQSRARVLGGCSTHNRVPPRFPCPSPKFVRRQVVDMSALIRRESGHDDPSPASPASTPTIPLRRSPSAFFAHREPSPVLKPRRMAFWRRTATAASPGSVRVGSGPSTPRSSPGTPATPRRS